MFQFSDYPLKPAPTTSASQLEEKPGERRAGEFPTRPFSVNEIPAPFAQNPDPTDVARAKYTVDSGNSEDIWPHPSTNGNIFATRFRTVFFFFLPKCVFFPLHIPKERKEKEKVNQTEFGGAPLQGN